MRVSMLTIVAFALIACRSVTGAGELGTPVDLSTVFDNNSADSTAGTEADGVLPVGSFSDAVASRRFYLTGIMGGSFATLFGSVPPDQTGPGDLAPGDGTTGTLNQGLFTGGGAAGVAFARSSGQLRVEFEGRGRSDLERAVTYNEGDDYVVGRARNNWSTLVNVWRDFDVTNRLGVYAGGGIGVGGYQLGLTSVAEPIFPGGPIEVNSTSKNINALAWQAGGGVNFALTKQVTIDLGYRFYAVGDGTMVAFDDSTITNNITASEVLLSVRVYEPFRGLLR